MNLNLIDIYADLQKVAIPQHGKEILYDRLMDDLHQAALRELDYQAAIRRIESQEPESASLTDTDGDGCPDYLDADPLNPEVQ